MCYDPCFEYLTQVILRMEEIIRERDREKREKRMGTLVCEMNNFDITKRTNL